MPVLSQTALPLGLMWMQGDPVDLTGILVGKAGSAGAATVESDNATVALMAVTLTIDNADLMVHFTLSSVNSASLTAGTYDYQVRLTGGPLLVVGQITVRDTSDPTLSAPVDPLLITPDDVFDWMGTAQGGIARKTEQMQKVVSAVISRINRAYIAPTTLPNDDWKLGHLMMAARYWKRHASPEGVISSDEFGTIRITKIDADIHDLLADFAKGPWPSL